MRVYIGISVEDTKVSAILFDVYGKRLESIDFERRPGMLLGNVEDEIISMIGKLIEPEIFELQTIGIGIDEYGLSQDGSVKVENIFENTPIADKIKLKFNCGVVVNSNVNCSIYGAYRYFDTLDRNIVGLFAGDRVGGAFIVDRKLYMGKHGTSDIGHLTLVPNGESCRCGCYGCLEAYASKYSIQKYIASQHKRGRASYIGESASRTRPMMMKSILNAYEREDEVTVEAIDRAFDYISLTVNNLVTLFKPDSVIFGGELFDLFGEKYIDRIKKYAVKNSNNMFHKNTKILISELGNINTIYGAYQLALDADIGCI